MDLKSMNCYLSYCRLRVLNDRWRSLAPVAKPEWCIDQRHSSLPVSIFGPPFFWIHGKGGRRLLYYVLCICSSQKPPLDLLPYSLQLLWENTCCTTICTPRPLQRSYYGRSLTPCSSGRSCLCLCLSSAFTPCPVLAVCANAFDPWYGLSTTVMDFDIEMRTWLNAGHFIGSGHFQCGSIGKHTIWKRSSIGRWSPSSMFHYMCGERRGMAPSTRMIRLCWSPIIGVVSKADISEDPLWMVLSSYWSCCHLYVSSLTISSFCPVRTLYDWRSHAC